MNRQICELQEKQTETSMAILEEWKKEIPQETIREILKNFSRILSGNIDRIIRKRLLHLLIAKITIDQYRNIDFIKLKLSDELVQFLQGYGGVAKSSF